MGELVSLGDYHRLAEARLTRLADEVDARALLLCEENRAYRRAVERKRLRLARASSMPRPARLH